MVMLTLEFIGQSSEKQLMNRTVASKFKQRILYQRISKLAFLHLYMRIHLVGSGSLLHEKNMCEVLINCSKSWSIFLN